MAPEQRPVGPVELGGGCHAWLQGDGGWGWSNAGLVVGDGASLLVDTLFDLKLTQAMLDGFAPVTAGAPIATLVNTHANGDHCYGNQLVAGADIVASAATAEEMGDVGPPILAALNADPGPDGDLFRHYFGEFDFEGITITPPTTTFSGRLDLDVAGTAVELHEVGPAHTRGDTIAHVPSAGTVFTGDILFVGGTPIVWAGPLSNWIRACDLILDLGADTVVPGHGPVTDADGVRTVRDYLQWVDGETRRRQAEGRTAEEAAAELAAEVTHTAFASLGEAGRIAVNVEAVYREVDPGFESSDLVALFRRMAALEGWLPRH